MPRPFENGVGSVNEAGSSKATFDSPGVVQYYAANLEDFDVMYQQHRETAAFIADRLRSAANGMNG